MLDLVGFQRPITDMARLLKNRPYEAVGAMFVVLISLMVYFFATFGILLPVTLKESSMLERTLGFLLPTWIIFAIISNMVMIKKRDSSIRGKILKDPVLKVPPPMMGCSEDGSSSFDEFEIKERTKFISQHFMARPFGEDEPWHICAVCEVFVPPRTWHCDICNTCILRRDHHCLLTMGCIGEANHANFMGVLFYLGLGATIAFTVGYNYNVYHEGTVWYMVIAKCLVPFYLLIFDFDIYTIITGICLLGQFCAWSFFFIYLWLSLVGQTSADWSRGISRRKPGRGLLTYENLKLMVGPSPFLRILWPFHQVRYTSMESTDGDQKENLRRQCSARTQRQHNMLCV